LAGIATDRTTEVGCRAALAVNTGFTRGAADIAARLKSWATRCAIYAGLARATAAGGAADLSSGAATSIETGFIGITTHVATAVVRATLSVPIAKLAGIVTT
jgi:hypothetical protein